MKPKLSLITLGVDDIARAKEFYTKLGFSVADETEDMVMFQTEGTWLGLFPWKKLAKDATVDEVGSGFRRVAIAHNEPTKEGVDRVIDEARALGATIVKEPEEVFWGGYSGYFADLDGHLWEVAMNPFTDLT